MLNLRWGAIIMHTTHITKKEISAFEASYRAKFINSLSGFKSANLIGTIDERGETHLTIISSVQYYGYNPPLIGFIVRPNSAASHSLDNIKATKQYTINQVSGNFWHEAHATSDHNPDKTCEFKKSGLTKQFNGATKAPFVAESALKYSLKLKEIVPIQCNDMCLIIGEIEDVILDQKALKSDGYIDIETLHSVAISGGDSYHVTQRLSRVVSKNSKHIQAANTDEYVPDWF